MPNLRMLFIFILIFVTVGFSMGDVLSHYDGPEWLVKITSNYKGQEIVGTGYIVQIEDKLYVRTASHVTVGNKATYQLTNGQNINLSQTGTWITNNKYDDQLIGIQFLNIKPLGIYKSKSKIFVLNPDLVGNFKKNHKIQKIERSDSSSFFLVTPWIKREIENFEKRRFGLGKIGDFTSTEVRFTEGNVVVASDIRILPGESGTPVVGTIYRSYLEQFGESYPNINTTEFANRVPIILGHALSYNYEFPMSSFGSPYRTGDLITVLINSENKNLDIGNVEWEYVSGTFFRKMNFGNKILAEANILIKQGGDDTAGNGGSGCRAGDGTAGNGGAGCSANFRENFSQTKIAFGVKHGNDHIMVLKARYKKTQEPYLIYANWDNFIALQEESLFQDIEMISTDQSLTELIKLKIEMLPEENIISSSYEGQSCIIDRKSLDHNILKLSLKNYGIDKLEFNLSTSDQKIQFSPIYKGKLNKEISPPNGGKFVLDLRGLYSIDLTQFSSIAKISSESELEHFARRPYVIVLQPNGRYSYLLCNAK